MAVREHWEIKWIQWIAVQENWVTQVSIADTINFVWGATVTDVQWVATVNIPYWCTWYREDVPAGSATYTFVNSPATDTSFLIFTDSGTLLFLGIDYTYDSDTETITFLSLGSNEAAYIWVAHAPVMWGGIGDMLKAVYDPNNVQQNVYDYNYFINTPTIWDATLTIQRNWTTVDTFTANATTNKTVNILVPTTVAELSDASDYVTNTSLSTTLNNYVTNTELTTTLSDYVTDSELATELQDYVQWPASATDWNIAVFDWTTGKLIKDSWISISVTSTQPSGDACEIYYDNGTIYFYVKSFNILLENWNDISTEDWNNILVLEEA